MLESDKTSVKVVNEELSYAIVAPNKKETMFLHMKELKSL
jgi:hypothetical protein